MVARLLRYRLKTTKKRELSIQFSDVLTTVERGIYSREPIVSEILDNVGQIQRDGGHGQGH